MKYLAKLRKFIQPYSWQILTNMVFLLSITILSLVIPNIIRQVIDNGLTKGDTQYIVRAAFLLLGVGVGSAGLSFAQRYISEWVAAHIGYDIRTRVYDHLQYLPFAYHDHIQSGQLISRCIEDVRAIQAFAGNSVVEIMQLSFLSVGVIAILFITNPILAVIALLPLIPMALMTTDFGRRVTNLFYAVDNALGDISARLQENVTGAQVIRAFAREPYEIKRFEASNKAYFQSRIKVIGEWSKVMPTTNLLIMMSTILILWFGGQMVFKGQMSVGELVAFNAYLLLLSAPVQQLAWLVNAAGEAGAGAQRVFEVLETVPEIRAPERPAAVEELDGAIAFEDVWLTYPGESRSSLSGINVEIKPHQTVAIIGPTGSGKTSLVNLVPRFYDVTKGRLLLDGVDVRYFDPVELRHKIGVVLQTSLLFSDQIKENIAYGCPDATMDEIIRVAKIAQAHEFIMKLPNGYETIIGERGVTLSGGQRQRIAIARAMLIRPRILILDDSTSSVDIQTEKELQKALTSLMESCTTLIIAHRLATLRSADVILVMDRGKIIQQGTYEHLISEKGLFKDIHDLQLTQLEESQEEKDALAAISQDKESLKNRRSADRSLS